MVSGQLEANTESGEMAVLILLLVEFGVGYLNKGAILAVCRVLILLLVEYGVGSPRHSIFISYF